MKYNFDEIINRRNTASIKWDFGDELVKFRMTPRFDEDTLPLFTADMDIACPPQIVEAMHKTADQRIYGYTLAPDSYYEAIINWQKKRNNWEIRKEEIMYCPGTVHAIGVAIDAFTKEGGGVIIQRPVYTPFTTKIEKAKRVAANNQLLVDEEGHYSLNLKEFEELCQKEENSLFILCNPHNPTGRIFTNENLKRIADICRENNVVIIADEIHGDLIRQNQTFTPIVKTTNKIDHIVSCTAINKTFNVAGLHATAVVIQDKELRNKFKKSLGFPMPTPFTINAVIAAYNECEDWLEQLKTYFDETFEWVSTFLQENMPKVKFQVPEGTYIFWMDFRDYRITKEEIKKRIYEDANVMLESGPMFDPDLGAGFERICLSSPRPIIKEAFGRICKAFEDIN